MRGDLEALPACLAGHVIIDADEMILRLGEETAIAFVRARWNLGLLRSAHASDRVLVGTAAARARKAGGALLGLLAEDLALIHRGSVHRVDGPAKAGPHVL